MNENHVKIFKMSTMAILHAYACAVTNAVSAFRRLHVS